MRVQELTDFYEADKPPAQSRATVETIETDSGLSLDIAVADARRDKDGPTNLFFLPWSEYVSREDALDRQSMIAHATGARVISLGNIGIGPTADKLPRSMKKKIAKGDFSEVAKAQIDALSKSKHEIDLDGISLTGYSLGAAVLSRFARELKGNHTIGSITLLEPVGIVDQPAWSIVRKFIHEAANFDKVYPERKDIHPEWMAMPGLRTEAVKDMLNKQFYLSYIKGLSKAPILNDLIMAYRNGSLSKDTPIRTINGSESVISPTEENVYMERVLRIYGLESIQRDVYKGDSHAVIDVPRRLASILLDDRRGMIEE